MADEAPRAPSGLVEHFFRHESGRLVSSLVGRYGVTRLALIEDAVQSSLQSALTSWGTRGTPDNPSAWLTRVARNRLIDQLRRTGREAEPSSFEASAEPPDPVLGLEIPDDQLRMLFVCCDDALSARAQLVLSLKLLCGFSTEEIAARLFITPDNAQKILSRGRQHLRSLWSDSPGDWSPSSRPQLTPRLASVQAVIYLLFNEGYSSRLQDRIIRKEMCGEALRLGQRLVSHPVGDAPETWALLSLMHLHHARIEARTDSTGNLLLLAQQDRSRWDADEIRRGLISLAQAGQGEYFSRYHGEAAILAEHCTAPSFEKTRWHEIVDLYGMLERHVGPSPLYTLNCAIALAQWKGPQAGLAHLQALTPPAWLARYYLWDGALGMLLRETGQFRQAEAHLLQALRGAPTRAEQQIFERQLRQSRLQDSGPLRDDRPDEAYDP